MEELSERGQPFNLILPTVDTHFEDGYVCEPCGESFADNQYANVMACSSKQVVEFIAWIQQQDFYDNTTIVICGDHPTMDKDFCQDVPDCYLRKTIIVVINPAVEPIDPTCAREFSTMDMFPNTQAAMSVEIDGERLGFGANLFSDTPALTEELGHDCYAAQLNRASLFLKRTFTLGNSEGYLDEVAQDT